MLKDRKDNYFKNRKLPKLFEIQDNIKTYNFDFDVEKPIKFYTPALQGSVEKICQDHFNPEVLENKLQKMTDDKKKKILEKRASMRTKMIESQYSDNSALAKRRLQEKKLKKMLALKEVRRQKIKTQKKASLAAKTAVATKKK